MPPQCRGIEIYRKWSFFLNWDSLHARLKQPLRDMELQEKEAQKD